MDGNIIEGNNNENTIKIYYFDRVPGYAVFEQEDYSEKITLTPILTQFSNLCQSLHEESSEIQNVIFAFTLPKDKEVKVEYEGQYLTETKRQINGNLIVQYFTITNPIENTYVKVYGNENEYKTFKIEFSKNYFPEFIEKEITLEQSYHNFELHFSSSTDEFDDYINQGIFYYFGSNEGNVCNYYDKDTLTLHCHTYDYRNTNTKTITFQDKCGNTKKINLQINIIPSVNYENNLVTTSIKFNGKYFIL